jgi:hypothetical protein
MINKVLKVLRDDLDTALNAESDEPVVVVVDNIAKEDNDATGISDKVVITLLSVEEETTLKNTPRYERTENPKDYKKNNPPAYLNLYVMVAANRDTYEYSLRDISIAIETIQTKKILVNEAEEFKCKIQMHTLPFDQLSYVWGLLGGKVIPSAFYKISIVKIQKDDKENIELITQIDVKEVKNEYD